MSGLPASFASGASATGTGPSGERADQSLIDHTDRLQRKLHVVTDDVFCMVGNGLSNQTFVRGPEGVVAIDTGESVEEMAEALRELRHHTDAPIAAVVYSHFHYVNGTTAVFDDGADASVPIWGHVDIEANLRAAGVELAPVSARGVIAQFGVFLPADGPDGLLNVGLGLAFRKAEHAPFTPGHVPATDRIDRPTTATLAGLTVEFRPAPSDAEDNVTMWFPELGVCVHNIVWPALFNVFPIRGEEYRDPRVLLSGIEEIIGFAPEHLVGAHGPPLSGADRIRTELERYRDSIQFLWDQTVRGINRNLTLSELTEFVQLPDTYGGSYLTQQHYGLVEHHVKQIHAGLRGWFDGDESTLFPPPTIERNQRLIAGFGGREVVAEQARQALDDHDLRWALELATWLVRSEADDNGRADGGSAEERALLAEVLRTIGQRTTSANIRCWTLTRARELEGSFELERFRTHRLGRSLVLDSPASVSVHGLRVLLEPDRAEGVDVHLGVELDGDTAGVHVRNHVAVPTDGAEADVTVSTTKATWADLLGGTAVLSVAIEAGDVTIDGDAEIARVVLAAFEVDGLRR